MFAFHPVILALAFAASAPSAQHVAAPHQDTRADGANHVLPNDNRRPAGTVADGVLTLELRAATGAWRPEGDSGPALDVQAFGESGAPLTSPAPLIRVPEGTRVRIGIRNDLTNALRLSGFCEHGAGACPPLDVPAGERREAAFTVGAPGTYQYWATSTGMPLTFRAVGDTQLSGAFVVDPAGTVPDDRVLVITDWSSLTLDELRRIAAADDPGQEFLRIKPRVLFAINGRAWPNTERLTYTTGDTVRWRVVNLSTQLHPMHLHGFYFDVDAIGDGMRDKRVPPGDMRVFTQLMPPGSTMALTWHPERVGNWLFHCHILPHVSPSVAVDGSAIEGAPSHEVHDAAVGMTGMVLGITVVGPEAAPAAASARPTLAPASRKLTMVMRSEPGRYRDAPAYGFVLEDDVNEKAGPLPVPGPTLVLERDAPVEITLVNRLPESTAIHWHGMELESYYDGVHGYSGTGQRVTPLIRPGESFVVRFTPPRAGTFMYHTHMHDGRQLTSGLYGAMIVTEPGGTVDPAVDHPLVISRGGPALDAPTVLNGEQAPRLVWRASTTHRLRLVNITPGDVYTVALRTADGPVEWRPVAKDAIPLPPERCGPGPATQLIGVGETYDFEVTTPPGRKTLWLEIRTPGGKWQAQGQVIIR